VVIASSGFGMGIANPASNNAAIDQPSNNAAIDQAPDNAASITGIRCMFRLAGGTISILVRRARAVPICRSGHHAG
jgi:hypothetical protein